MKRLVYLSGVCIWVLAILSCTQPPQRQQEQSVWAMPASTAVPGGVENPPQFIVIGSDDNASAEAVNWMTGVLRQYRNKNDNSLLRMSFYSNTGAWDQRQDLVAAHQEAYRQGHEVSNHTAHHIYCVDGTMRLGKEEILNEILSAQTTLEKYGIPKKHQFGFRTPYLAYSDSTFQAMKEAGYIYDCSVNGGTKWGLLAGNYYWPYTLDFDDRYYEGESYKGPSDNYAPDNCHIYNWWNQTGADAPGPNPIGKHPGIWELPCYMYVADTLDHAHLSTVLTYDHGGKVTALDYNMWAGRNRGGVEFNKEQSLRTLKNTLRMMLNGNRTPMTMGVHSQYYFSEEELFPNMMDFADRRWVFEEFVKYAVTLDDVWFVSGDMVIRYMQKPVTASQFKPEDYAVIPIEIN